MYKWIDMFNKLAAEATEARASEGGVTTSPTDSAVADDDDLYEDPNQVVRDRSEIF